MHGIRILTVSALLALGLSPVAHAQTSPSVPPVQRDSNCAPGTGAQSRMDGTRTDGSGAPSSNLSDRLAESKGVICPSPSLDSDMSVQPSESGHIRVIPPPGSPGGDPSIQPK